MERGKANVSIQILERVAANLGITVIALLDNEHEAEREFLVKEITEFLKTTSDEKVKVVYKIIRGLE